MLDDMLAAGQVHLDAIAVCTSPHDQNICWWLLQRWVQMQLPLGRLHGMLAAVDSHLLKRVVQEALSKAVVKACSGGGRGLRSCLAGWTTYRRPSKPLSK